MPAINSDALVACPLCAGDGFLTHADKSTTVCALCQGRGKLHEEFVALCRGGFAGDAPDGLDIEWWCDECGKRNVKGLAEHEGGYDTVICYPCWCRRSGIVLPVYEAGEAEPF